MKNSIESMHLIKATSTGIFRPLMILAFLCIGQSDIYHAQKHVLKKTKATTPIQATPRNKEILDDTAYLNQIAAAYADSLEAIIDSLLADTAFIHSLGDTSAGEVGEFVSPAYEISLPLKGGGWVNDYAFIFSKEEISELDSIIKSFEKQTTNEIAIVTFQGWWATKENFDSLTLSILRNWGIGKKGRNNGIVIGISPELRMIRIENGYGIEAKMSDAETKKILDEVILPAFRNGNYFEGTKRGLLAIMEKIR